MSESTNRPIADDAGWLPPTDHKHLINRLRQLAKLRYTTVQIRVELSAIGQLLDGQSITAGELWQLLLAQYGIASNVSGTPDPSLLAMARADQSAVWKNLSAVLAGDEVSDDEASNSDRCSHCGEMISRVS